MKILHGPVNVGNQPWVLSRAERRLGAASELVVRNDTWLKYPADVVLAGEKAGFAEVAMRSIAYGLLKEWSYDVLHFYFGQTFLLPGFPVSGNKTMNGIISRLTSADLRLCRSLGKKLFMTLQGCDIRLAQEGNRRNEWTMCASQHCELFQRCVDVLDQQRRHLAANVLPLFDRVFYLNPELGHIATTAQFLPYANVEIGNYAVTPPSPRGKPRIVHAPSVGRIKGTPLILDALKKLESSYDFELILVEKKSHDEALELYRSADIAIDQVLAGWYGGFAVEMMAMGKPVGCYIRESDLKFVPEAMRQELPVFNLNPGNLAEGIAAMLDRRSEWEWRGQQSRRYVERWHNPDLIAQEMLRAYARPDSRFDLDFMVP